MNKLSTVLLSAMLLLLSSCSDSAPEDAGKLRIKADKTGATIYIDGDKKGMIGDSGYTNILLEEGEYEVKVEKASSNGEWLYTKTRTVFLGANSSVKLNFKLDGIATEKRKERLEKEEKERKIRLAKEEKERKIRLQEYINRYTIHNNGTVTDKNTGLMWMRCSMGQTWDGSTCVGKGDEYYYPTAEDLTTNFAGYDDWRTPTIKELNTLVYCSNGKERKFRKDGHRTIESEGGNGCESKSKGRYQKPTIYISAFPNTSSVRFWSSSHRADRAFAWDLNFFNGVDNLTRGPSFMVRLVRLGE